MHANQAKEFVDYYEVLQISKNAHADTIDRIFRLLAQRYHPDNKETADVNQFRLVVEAHETLRNVESRARYDLIYQEMHDQRLRLSQDIFGDNGHDSDRIIQERLLSAFYIKCRSNVGEPGIGDVALEALLGCPREILEFHLWYFREKGWIQRLDNGLLAITAAGVDRAIRPHSNLDPQTLLTDQHIHPR